MVTGASLVISVCKFGKFIYKKVASLASLVQVWGLISPGNAWEFLRVLHLVFACEVGVLWGFSKFGRSKKFMPSLLSSMLHPATALYTVHSTVKANPSKTYLISTSTDLVLRFTVLSGLCGRAPVRRRRGAAQAPLFSTSLPMSVRQ